MKIRNGFVSNSSSSSFIVHFDKDPRDKENLREMLGDCSVDPYGTSLTAEQVLEIVHKDVMSSERRVVPMEFDEYDIRWEIKENIPGAYDIDDELLKELVKMEKEHRINMFKIVHKANTGTEWTPDDAFVYAFEYSDESRVGSALEHGGVFRNVKHERISNH